MADTGTFTLHIANRNYSSWSLRPWVLMRALGIDFTEQVTPFESMSNRELFRQFSPNGMVPCLHAGGLRIWDSLAIMEFLAERDDRVWPSDTAARAWARCASAEMHSGFGMLRDRCTMNCGLTIRLHRIEPELQRDIDRLDELWQEGLHRFGGPFLAGPTFTAVDAMYAPVAFRVLSYELMLGDAAMAYCRRLLDLPAMVEWYDAALAEPWREAQHEADVLRVGTVTQDRRERAGTGAR